MNDLPDLGGKKGLIFGIANEQSLAYGVAEAAHEAGADVAVTYLNEKAEPHVRPLAEKLSSPIIASCDVRVPGQLEAVFEEVRRRWGRLDFLLHAMAYAPLKDLQGRLVDSSLEGWTIAMDVSVHSFIRMARLAEPLMTDGGCLITLSYLGGDRVIRNYHMMGPVKAALERTSAYLAVELGSKGIRVYTISPGPVRTRAASGLSEFDKLLTAVAERAPGRRLIGINDVGNVAVFLMSDLARGMTGNLIYVDAGYNILGD